MKIMSCIPFGASNSGFGKALGKTFALTGLLAALQIAPALADETADVSKLLRAGQHAEALSKADAFLAQKPRDAQMRFLKGVILTEQNKQTEAITQFTKLTEDFPELPEPYNNLAVLFASSGQYDKARAALDMAIRTNPSYATAYENLGDVHAKLASQAYDKALQLDSGNSAAKSKLTLLRTLSTTGVNQKVAAAKPVAVAAAPAPAPVAAPAAPVAKVEPAKPAVVVKPEPAKVEPAKPTVVAKAEPIKPETKPEARPEPKAAPKPEPKSTKNDDDRDDVMNTVQAWAKAWSSKDVKGYLNFYGNDFQPPKGESRKAWAEERNARIAGKGRISVRIDSPQVTINGNTATVKFRQVYESDQLHTNSRKTLVMTRQGEKWQIRQEQSGS